MAEIGSTLRETRMRARIDISEVEARTKIRAKYLRAIENEEWNLLPGPIYVKSFLRTYGDFLGLDSRLLIDEFKRRYERPSDHEVRTMGSSVRERDRHRRQPGRLRTAVLSPRGVIGLALVVIVAALYVIGSHSSTNSGTPGGTAITPATSTTGRGHGAAGAGARTATTTSPLSTAVAKAPAPRVATLALVPTAPVWVCVENQTGKPVFSATTYGPGAKIPTARARELLVTLGNSHVTMTVDGRSYTPTGSNAISLKITPTGVRPLATSPTCGQ